MTPARPLTAVWPGLWPARRPLITKGREGPGQGARTLVLRLRSLLALGRGERCPNPGTHLSQGDTELQLRSAGGRRAFTDGPIAWWGLGTASGGLEGAYPNTPPQWPAARGHLQQPLPHGSTEGTQVCPQGSYLSSVLPPSVPLARQGQQRAGHSPGHTNCCATGSGGCGARTEQKFWSVVQEPAEPRPVPPPTGQAVRPPLASQNRLASSGKCQEGCHEEALSATSGPGAPRRPSWTDHSAI